MIYSLKNLVYIYALLIPAMLVFRFALRPQYRALVGPKAVVLTLLTPAVGLFIGNVYLFFAYLVCAIGLTSRTRVELFGTYLLLLPMMPALKIETHLGSVYLFALSALVAMNAGALVGLALTRGRVRRTDLGLDLCALVVVAFFSFVDARGGSATMVLRAVTQNVLLFWPPYLLASRCVADLADLRRVLAYLCFAAVMGSFVAVFGAFKHWDVFEALYPTLKLNRDFAWGLFIRGGQMRTGSTMADYTAFGLFLGVVLVALPTLRDVFGRSGTRLVAVILLFGLYLSQSRGAWIGLLVGYVASLALRGRAGRALFALGAAVATYGLLVLVATPGSALADILGLYGTSAAGTAEYRQLLFKRGMEQISAHPLAGRSVGDLVAALPDLVQGQGIVDFVNTHLFVAMAGGVPSFVVWTIIWIVVVARVVARRGFYGRTMLREGTLTSPAAMIVVSMAALAFTSTVDRNLFWPLIALGLSTPLLVARRVHRPIGASGGAESRAGRLGVPDEPALALA